MKMHLKIISSFCILFLIFFGAISTFGEVIEKEYTISRNDTDKKCDTLIKGGNIYVNLFLLQDLLGFSTSIQGDSITIKDISTTDEHILPSGDLYIGDIKNNVRSGNGTLFLKDGGKYEGEWLNGVYEGNGTLVLPSGQVYMGQFSKGFMHGEGKMYYSDGSYYIGAYEYGIREGFGFLFEDKDNKYRGYWSNGLRNGKGKATVNGAPKKGLWENNQYMKSLTESNFDF